VLLPGWPGGGAVEVGVGGDLNVEVEGAAAALLGWEVGNSSPPNNKELA